MIEAQILLPETFLDALIRHLVAFYMFFPELDGALGHTVRRGLDLPGSRAALHAVKREGGVDRARFAVRVRVVQMIMSEASVEQDSLLDQTLSADLRHKIDVFLGAGGANSDVM